ncbi:Protein NRD1 [Parelaphostrongylus tenuis]|uniref:Protein NRD1 n=1 Tax=Parelaphostrongylus tenuis TaxID=148309 RepID=A0AAD5N5V2_PARTN|nr:Protein NRD1 [Parelaphostrongylus tenuis]
MDTESVKAFNAELTSVYDSKPPLSKKKIQDIAKVALKAKSYYKHVVFSVEKFLAKCKIEYKIPCLYVIDSIIRTSKHQLKEKDVFAARFLKNFSKTLADLLTCPVCDQPRVIRTLNLWGANGVYTEEQLAPFKQQCRDMGIETDIERVERLVKGDDADMSRYGGAYGRAKEKERKKRRNSASDSPTSSSNIQQNNQSLPIASTTPPMPAPSQLIAPVPQITHDPSLLGAIGDLNNEPSDEVPPCGLSERKLLDMILDANFEISGAFKNDIVLLRKAHGLICRALDARIRAVGDKPEIKDLLSSQFDYSDEEDDGEDNKKAKRPTVTKVCQEDLLSIARNLIEDPNVIAAFKHMHAERVLVLNQIAAQTQQRTLGSSATKGTTTLPTTAQIQGISLPKGLPPNISLPQGVPAGLPGIAGLPAVQSLSGLQSLAGLQSINLAQLSALNQANAAQPNQALLNLLANNSLVSKIGTLSNLQFANARPTPVFSGWRTRSKSAG